MKQKSTSFLYRNSLSLVVILLMVLSLTAQYLTGWREHNEERTEYGQRELNALEYIQSGHFMQSTFENWESEFLQMGLYVLLTVFLRQEGSAESKKLNGKEEVDREPRTHPDAPWPVKKGGWWLRIYSHSLSIAFGLLFLTSFVLHFCGSLEDHNDHLIATGKPAEEWTEYLSAPRFWFESFQNWQSEFLAVAAIVLLSIWLREKGSPESKPVDAPHTQTGGS